MPGKAPLAGRRRAARMAPEARRAQLLACAVRVFARRGLGAVRHADIAAEAAVSLPAVFFYFPTRGRLVDTVLGEVARHYLRMIDAVMALDVPPRERLLACARAFAASVDTHPDHARVWLDWSTAVRDELWPRYLRFQARVLQALARTIRTGQRRREIRRDVVATDAAHIMYAAAYAVMQLQLRGTTPVRRARFLKSVVAAVAPAERPGARSDGCERRASVLVTRDNREARRGASSAPRLARRSLG